MSSGAYDKAVTAGVSKPKIIITGDSRYDMGIYLTGDKDDEPVFWERWSRSLGFEQRLIYAGAANVYHYLTKLDYYRDKLAEYDIIEYPPSGNPADTASARSVPPGQACAYYILGQRHQGKTQPTPNEAQDPAKNCWRIDRAIMPRGKGQDCTIYKDFPTNWNNASEGGVVRNPDQCILVIMDYDEGWRRACCENKEFGEWLKQFGSFVVRTPDPSAKEWRELRAGMGENVRGLWYCSNRLLADGALDHAGNWEDLRNRVKNYFSQDSTLYCESEWKHKIVVQMDDDGVLILDGKKETLLICPGDQPGSFAMRSYGAVRGNGTLFVACLIEALVCGDDNDYRHEKRALRLVRTLLEHGYDLPTGEDPESPTVNFPMAKLEKLLKSQDQASDQGAADTIVGYVVPKADWKTVRDIIAGTELELRKSTVLKFVNVEITSPDYARTLLRLVRRLQIHARSGTGVLSFSILGGPGSGKSHLAKQIRMALDCDGDVFEDLPFNLSQIENREQLAQAFYQIQYVSLKGMIPFVLWDEFDTYHKGKQCGWLPSFLAPMQDGLFFDGSTMRPLGKCVFVFISGMFTDERQLREWAEVPEAGKLQRKNGHEDTREVKARDFHSRLESCLTLPKVDFQPKNRTKGQGGSWKIESHSSEEWKSGDPAKLVRAVLIREFLKPFKNLESISESVAAFLVHVTLLHGVRSLKSIINASELSRTKLFDVHHLAQTSVLKQHIRDWPDGIADADPVHDFLRALRGSYARDLIESWELKWKKQNTGHDD